MRLIDADKISFEELKNDFDRVRAKTIIMGQPTIKEKQHLRICGTSTVNGDCIFHKWIEKQGETKALVETKKGNLISLPYEWIYFYDSKDYLK